MPADDAIDIDLVSAQLRADARDLSTFAEGLAVKLEGAVPGIARVTRRRSGLAGPKRVREIAVDTDGGALLLQWDGSGMRTLRVRVSGGIVLSRETLDIDTWLADLMTTLRAEAARSAQTRQALERLLLS